METFTFALLERSVHCIKITPKGFYVTGVEGLLRYLGEVFGRLLS